MAAVRSATTPDAMLEKATALLAGKKQVVVEIPARKIGGGQSRNKGPAAPSKDTSEASAAAAAAPATAGGAGKKVDAVVPGKLLIETSAIAVKLPKPVLHRLQLQLRVKH